MAATLMDELQALHTDSWGWALACCQWQSALAEDALQEAYLRVLDGRARFAGRSSQKTWFFGVIRHVCAEQQRSQLRHSQLDSKHLQPANDTSNDDPAFSLLDADQSNQQLRDALLTMPARQREIMHLVFYADMTLEESAAALDITVGTARTHYHRGKQGLAKLLGIDNE